MKLFSKNSSQAVNIMNYILIIALGHFDVLLSISCCLFSSYFQPTADKIKKKKFYHKVKKKASKKKEKYAFCIGFKI